MDKFNRCYSKIKKWAADAEKAGWLSEDALTVFEQVDELTADRLFDTSQRPLLVAFFGGTGVGKSSLLNRLSDQEIARVGAIRPTSHNVTLYIHEAYKDHLEEHTLPTEDTKIVYHQDDNKRYFAWLDLPDIDSTEQHNRAIVEQWLPVVDWLIYVVTPERYQDEQGWRFVQQRGEKHNWLFVINHWDQGEASQREDFRQRLQGAGFSDPVILVTSCHPTIKILDDQFSELEARLQQTLKETGLEALQQQARVRQWRSLQQSFGSLLHRLESSKQWALLKDDWNKTLDQGLEDVTGRLQRNTDTQFNQWALQEENKPGQLPLLEEQTMEKDAGQVLNAICDQSVSTLLYRLRDEVENNFTKRDFSTALVRRPLSQAAEDSQEMLVRMTVTGFTAGIDKPGTTISRFMIRMIRGLRWLLPLSAALWATYHVVMRYQSGTDGGDFLGINFAIHSLMLIGLGWLVPYILLKQLKPSLARSAYQGIKQRIAAADVELRQIFDQVWRDINQEKQAYIERHHTIYDQYREELGSAQKLSTTYQGRGSRSTTD
ncbi:MAG: GTPase [Gammaproteobacteria bacterium]